LTIGQQAHLDVTSTKVNQPNKLKACMPYLYINYRIYNVLAFELKQTLFLYITLTTIPD